MSTYANENKSAAQLVTARDCYETALTMLQEIRDSSYVDLPDRIVVCIKRRLCPESIERANSLLGGA